MPNYNLLYYQPVPRQGMVDQNLVLIMPSLAKTKTKTQAKGLSQAIYRAFDNFRFFSAGK